MDVIATELIRALKGHGFRRAAKRRILIVALAAEGMRVVENAIPQGLKPKTSFAQLAARLKTCPFKARDFEFNERLALSRHLRISRLLAAALFVAPILSAQTPPSATPQPPPDTRPIAIVPLDSANPDQAARVTGALEGPKGAAIIVGSGSITSGDKTTQVELPYRGTLRICASTTVKLSADSSVKAPDVPGLMMAIDKGAIEASFATARSSDFLLTPDFRIVISGPGAMDLKVRLGQHGDTCVDDSGANAPIILVTSVFDGGEYRVQPGQRVMFQHGSLHEVVDQEKEPCGCPPSVPAQSNEFPLAMSEGLAPLPAATPGVPKPGEAPPAPIPPLVYNAAEHAPTLVPAAAPPPAPAPAPAPQKKTGLFTKVGHFFRRIFGAE
jgi:hypothetical protein